MRKRPPNKAEAVSNPPKPSPSDTRAIDAESRRVIREDLLTNILVEAGAGSGKTQMLAERMAAGVATGVYQVEHMAAVTFTRKAASELRGRFHLALEKKLQEIARAPSLESRGPEIERLNAALGNLERFFAGTIHSFCARLLRERPVESDISPGFTELDEVQDLELRNRVWRDFVTSTRSAGDPVMMALLEAEIRPPDLDSPFATVCLHEDVEFPPGEVDPPDPKPALKALEKFWNELQKHLPASIDPETNCPIQLAALRFKGEFDVARYRLDRPSVVASLLLTWDHKMEIKQFRWAKSAAEKRRFRDLINPLHDRFRTDTVAPFLSMWRQYVYKLSVTLLTQARDHAARERRRQNSLNYGDLLILTARVLRKNADVRHALQQKYRNLFVDEFQDTDPVQAEIVFLLAADEAVAAVKQSVASAFRRKNQETANWRSVSLRPGGLFVVGDPKQSIFRFRRADIDIYNIVRSRFSDPAIGKVLTLTMNFRSVAVLCEWANEVFEKQFPIVADQYSPRYSALDANDPTSTTGGVRTLTYSSKGKELIERDAARIAAYVRSEVDAGRRTFSDFLILTRKKRDRITPYANALEALNVPIEVSGAGAFGESAEVAALTVLLRALADPQDALALIAVLRGPLFGISDPELFAYKQSGGWFNVFESEAGPVSAISSSNAEPRTPSAVGAAVREALAALRQYYRWTRVLPAAAALDRILEHTGYLALAGTTPGGVEAGDVVHAVDRVRQVVEEGGSLADAADALEDDSEDNEVESLPLEPGRTDVVRVMNLHKAKGLEANVVFLADPDGGVVPRVDVHVERKGLSAQGWFKLVRKPKDKSWGGTLLGAHVDWSQHEQTEEPYRRAEDDRLLYVAATRARELLVVSRSTSNYKHKAWGVLNSFLASAKELAVSSSAIAAVVKPLDTSNQAHAEWNAALIAAQDRVRQASWSITSVTAEARHIARMTSAADATADDPTKVVGTDTPAHRADAGMAWGTLIHGLLEHAMRHPNSTREDLRRLAMWLTVESPELRSVVDLAIATVESVAAAAYWRQAKASEHSEETPFAFAEGQRLTMGVIDLIHLGTEGWRITDYKTDADGGVAKSEVYAAQTAAYRKALEACGVRVEDVALQSVRAK